MDDVIPAYSMPLPNFIFGTSKSDVFRTNQFNRGGTARPRCGADMAAENTRVVVGASVEACMWSSEPAWLWEPARVQLLHVEASIGAVVDVVAGARVVVGPSDVVGTSICRGCYDVCIGYQNDAVICVAASMRCAFAETTGGWDEHDVAQDWCPHQAKLPGDLCQSSVRQ
jgi:hypothetical protein